MTTPPPDTTDRRTGRRSGARPSSTWLDASPGARSAFRDIVPLTLVVLTLIGSVAIPALQSWRIMRLLRETTEVLAPARLLVEQLQSGLATEFVALQSYALTGDSVMLARHRAAAANDDRRLATLARLTRHFDTGSAARADVIRRRVEEWRQLDEALLEQRGSRTGFAAALRASQARYDSSLDEIAALSSDLAAGAATRDDRVRALEHLSIVSNGVLVLAALVAMSGVLILTLRQRRLSAMLRRRAAEEARLRQLARRRARRESALRAASEALAGAYTRDEVTELIVHGALEMMPGRGAFVEQLSGSPGGPPTEVVVRAVAGLDVPPLGATCSLAGSYTEMVLATGAPMLVADPRQPEQSGTLCAVQHAAGSAVVVPLGGATGPVGALIMVSSARRRFRTGDVARAGIFGHLAAMAYEKVGLLEEAYERRRSLEHVVQSRSRLIRGFSHDVKNAVGAADGFAELLSIGVYGELSEAQLASVGRLRRSLQGALVLIDDLHELGRAETGNLALSWKPVDLADVVHTLTEEYQAAAQRRGLSLDVAADPDLPIIMTDRARVRQIASNLLSNAIKYTGHGSVLMHARLQTVGPSSRAGRWVLLEFTDSGAGIPADKQDYIFEEFSRLGGGETPGAGLGLAISKLLAQALGGDISVESAPGHGSTFTLWLPLREPAEGRDDADEVASHDVPPRASAAP